MLFPFKKKSQQQELLQGSSVLLSEDHEWMIRVSRGDSEAFRQLYERYKGPVMSYVLYLVQNQTVAEELTQEIFLRVFRSRESYRPEAKFSTWLWTIARNAALDHQRKKGELLIQDLGPAEDDQGAERVRVEELEAPLSNAELLLIEHTERKKVDQCFAELSPPQREALTLRVVGNLSYDEIAETMGITLASVKSLINRAKVALMKGIAGEKEKE